MGNSKSRSEKRPLELLKDTVDNDEGKPLFLRSQDISFAKRIAQGKAFEGKYQGKVVVIKVPLDNVKAGDWFRQFEVLSSVQKHENVVTALGICQEPNNFAIVEEFYPRGSLKSYVESLGISEGKAWDSAALHSILLGVARGMKHLIGQKILLRGLKSSNICLDDHLTPKIVDFFDSRVFEDDHVQTEKYPVALAWAAPETIKERISSEKTDVYSFGALIFELLTGKQPFEGVLYANLADAINAGKSITDGIDTSSMQKEAVSLMEQCLQKDPGIRPTFDQIVQILENHLR